MSLNRNFGHKQAISQTNYNDRLIGYHKGIVDLSRLVQIQNMVQQTNREVEALKRRLNQLEVAATAQRPERRAHGDGEDFDATEQPAAPLPTAELKQLAEMAKRFK